MTMPAFMWLAFITGLATSFGPCLAPRYVALAAQLTSGASGMSIGSFLMGCIGGYVAFAAGGALVTALQASSPVVYALAGVMLATVGLRYLLAGDDIRHDHTNRKNDSFGARFLSGLCCSIFGAPCCMPVAVALGAQSSAYDVGYGALALAGFGIGQSLPLVVVALASRFRPIRWIQPLPVRSTIAGTLLIAMGALYGAIA